MALDGGIWARMADVLLPNGGYMVILSEPDALIESGEVYVDESGSHEGSPLLCNAGYVFKKQSAIDFDGQWKADLKEADLEYFRMSACAGGGEPFEDKTMPERIAIETKLIELTKRSTAYGFAVTLNEAEYDAIVPKTDQLGSAYSYCLRMCLVAVRAWAEHAKFNGDIAYFFESGHRHQAEANAIMDMIFRDPGHRARYRYAAHAFADKKKARPLQAADLLAWQWRNDALRKRAQRNVSRKDCVALIRPDKDYVMDFNAERLTELSALIRNGKIRLI
jgi:hypothetical protein